MSKYFKGNLFLKSDEYLPSRRIYLYRDEFLEFSNKAFLESYNKLKQCGKSLVIKSFFNEKVESPDVFKKMFGDKQWNIKEFKLSLIYEIITDEDDNLYAKELITGMIFPIVGNVNTKYNIVNRGKHRFIATREGYDRYIEVSSNVFESVFENSDGQKCYIKKEDSKKDSFVIYLDIEFFSKAYNIYYQHYAKEFLIEAFNTYEFSNLQRGECYILNEGSANELEIEEYKRMYQKEKKPFFKRNYMSFQDKVVYYAKLNVFDREIVPKKEEVKEKKEVNYLGKLMDEIEYLLLKLKNHSDTLYYKYYHVYEELCSTSDLKHGTLDKSTLESLKANILLSLEYDGNAGMNIIDYLEYMKNEYLKNVYSKKENNTKITINDLDRIMELYLQTQEEYDLVVQRKIIRNISLLYLFELYENKDNLDEFNLETSYVNEVLKTILVCIDKLREEGIIKKNILVDLSAPSLDNVLELIRSIEFKEKDKIKRIV